MLECNSMFNVLYVNHSVKSIVKQSVFIFHVTGQVIGRVYFRARNQRRFDQETFAYLIYVNINERLNLN